MCRPSCSASLHSGLSCTTRAGQSHTSVTGLNIISPHDCSRGRAQFASAVFQGLGLIYFNLHCPVCHLGCGGVQHVAAVEEVTVLRVPHQRQRPVSAGRHLARDQSSRRSCIIIDDVIYGQTPSISQELTYGCDGEHEAARGEHGDHDQCQCPPRPAVRRALMGPSHGSARHRSDRHPY